MRKGLSGKRTRTKYICQGCLETFYPPALLAAFKTVPKCPCCGSSKRVKKA